MPDPTQPLLAVPATLTRSSAFLLARIGVTTRERFGALLEPLGLRPKVFGVLTIIAARPGVSQHQLGASLGIDPSSMVAFLDELEAAGLAERRVHPDDRRARRVHLTAEGKATLRRARARAGALEDEVLAPLSPPERELLHELLLKLVEQQ